MRSVIQKNWDECFLCHGIPTDVHHCLMGSNRKDADKYKLVIHVCRNCHNKIHAIQELADTLKRLAQKVFEEVIGTREEFIKIFGRSYL